MSLINQMLRDLEERRQGETRQQAGGDPAPVVMPPASPRRSLLLLTSGVLLAVAIWGGSELLQEPESVDPSVKMTAVAVAQPKKLPLAPELQVADEAPVLKTVAVVVEAPRPEAIAPRTIDNVVKETAEASVEPSLPEVADVAVIASSRPEDELVALVVEPAVTEKSQFQKMIAPPSPQEQAQSLYLQALSLQQQGDAVSAESQLLQALQLNPQLLDARLQLISLLRQNNRPVDAFFQVEEGLRLHPQSSLLRKDKARQLLAAGQIDDAIALLQDEPLPAMASDLEYHALLAALLQETGAYPQAAGVYRSLLSYRPQESMWWLGLAISLDQSGESAQAKSAYRKVSGQFGLRADLAEYVASRLQAL